MAKISCPHCGKSFSEEELAGHVSGCGELVIPAMPPCTKAGVAEHAGFPDSDEPCDAGQPA